MMKDPTDHLTSGELQAYQDGELRDFKFEMHVMSCRICQKKLKGLEGLREIVGDALKGYASGPSKFRGHKGKESPDLGIIAESQNLEIGTEDVFLLKMSGKERLLDRAKALLSRPQEKEMIGKFLSADLENEPADIIWDDVRITIDGMEGARASEVFITITDKYTGEPISNVDVTLFPESGGFKNAATDQDGKVYLKVPEGTNRLLIHTKQLLETVLVNIPD